MNITIIGPISDFGGREVEAQIIARSLVDQHNVTLLSTISMNSHSSAIFKHERFKWNSIEKFIYESNLIIRSTSLIAKHLHNRKDQGYSFIGNKISHVFYSFNNYYSKVLKYFVEESDVVFFCGELKSKWLVEIITFCSQNKTPLVIRTTGKIKEIPSSLLKFSTSFCHYITHSNINSIELQKHQKFKVSIIDQTSLNESQLLKVDPGMVDGKIRYGFLGRFAREKGLSQLLYTMKESKRFLTLAGDGQLLEEVEKACSENSYFEYIGLLSNQNISSFFKRIDVLIISSLHEAGPLVGIEAMAAAKIIVSTNVGAMRERLYSTKNQFWFDSEDFSTLNGALAKVENLEIDELIEIKKGNRENYVCFYSNSSIATRYRDLISDATSAVTL